MEYKSQPGEIDNERMSDRVNESSSDYEIHHKGSRILLTHEVASKRTHRAGGLTWLRMDGVMVMRRSGETCQAKTPDLYFN